MSITIRDLLNIDYERAVSVITRFIMDYVTRSGRDGVVLGLSGGIDSSVTLYLCVRALGSSRVLALIMPYVTTPREDVEDAIDVAKRLGVKHYVIDITEIRNSFARSIPEFDETDRVASGNLLPRIRMTILYYYANRKNLLVVGTGDKSELLLGYFTKYGDGGVDIMPIGCLYKTQVRRLGEHLGVPERIVRKPSSPRLWAGHLAEEELGAKYEDVDVVLYSLHDLKLSVEEASVRTGKPLDLVMRVYRMYVSSQHKRALPPIPPL